MESISFPISAELTYGLERIAAFLQDVDSIYDIVWARDPGSGRETNYGEVRLADELQMSVYNFDMADVASAWKHFDLCEAECTALISSMGRLGREIKVPALSLQKQRTERQGRGTRIHETFVARRNGFLSSERTSCA